MALPRLPAPYRWLALGAAAVLFMLLGGWITWKVTGLATGLATGQLMPPPAIKLTAKMLRDEEILFLVTNRIVTQVMVEQKQDSLWAGVREGILIATVKLYHGVDMQHIADSDIHDLGDRVVIVLPPPRLLDFAIEPDFKIITKRSGVNVMLDWYQGNDLEMELRVRIQDAALTFAKENDLLPKQEQVLRRLNRFATTLSQQAGKPVEFSFEPPVVEEKAAEGEPPAAPAP